MSGSVEIVLWLQEYKLQALEAQLARDGCSTEKLLQDMLDDLYHYPLTEEERAVLRTRMDGYCMEQTGLGLEEHRSQYLAETDGPAQGPRM